MRAIKFSAILFILATVFYPSMLNARTVPRELIVKLHQAELISEKKGESQTPPTVFKSVQKSLISARPLFGSVSSPKIFSLRKAESFKNHFFILQTKASVDSDSLLHVLQALPQVEYAVPNHLFRVDWKPDDPNFNKQWGLQKIGAERAWNLTRGDPSVLLAVIDTGIDYKHPDLKKAIWINPGEDLNHNGQVDSSDFNGIDDDHNGFVDDIQGWDFVDAPNYPDAGDYRNRDNNPADENGHGTAVAGIIAATADNGIGVAGVAPNCRVMNLRAGTSRGLLEEDDVAAAVMYAVENGARVINMSFGDVAVTAFLRDVLQFAYENNVLGVASSGNSGNSVMHYPSGLPQTLSVGASTKYDARAGFSTYGISLDLVAPGERIFTTLRNNSYSDVSGTSAAAPFVTGSAGLVLSLHPDFSAEMLKHVLISTCDDLGQAGWDSTFGAGRLNAFRALGVSGAPVAEIETPRMDQGFSGGKITITGTASSPLFQQARISVGTGDNPSDWVPIKILSTYQKIDDTLAQWPVPLGSDTSFTIRLQVLSTDGTETDDFVRIIVDHTPPVVKDSLTLQPMIMGDKRVLLGEFATDDFCDAALFYRANPDIGSFQMTNLPFAGRKNSFLLDPASFPPQGDFYVSLQNRAGLTRRLPEETRLFHFDLTHAFYPQLLEEMLPAAVPSGYLLPYSTDFNQNGAPELVMNQYKSSQLFGPLSIFEWKGREFVKAYQTDYVAIPRDTGDVNGDGRPELLAGAGGTTYLFASGAGGWPSRLVWWDSSDVWGSRLIDLDGDGRKDILARKGNVFKTFHNMGDFKFVATDSFPNSTAGNNGTGVPHVEIGDFTQNGQKDLLFGDYDGDVYMYEVSSGGVPKVVWRDRLPLIDTIDFLTSGDFDGNGSTDFAVGCHSKPDIDLEHVFDSRRWLVRIYTHVAGDSFAVAWQQEFYGFHSPKNFPSGMASGDVTGDGRTDLLLGFYPNFYVIHFDAASATYEPVWCGNPTRTNSAVVADFNGDGRNELVYDSGSGLQRIQFPGENQISQRFFEDFKAIPLDTERVALSWNVLTGAVSFHIFRGEANASDSIEIGETTGSTFLDSTVRDGRLYRYWISAEKNGETQRSVKKIARPHRPVRLVYATVVLPNQFRLYFSGAILAKAIRRECFVINQPELSPSDRKRHPVSFVVGHGGSEILLTDSLATVPAGTVQISVSALSDSEGTPVDEKFRRVMAVVPSQIHPPYVTRADFLSPNRIQLWFNEPMDSVSAVSPNHYQISPFISVLKANWDRSAPDRVLLLIGSERPIGALGVRYRLTVQDVKNQQGVPIKKGQGDHKAFQFYRTDLSRVFTYPNPVRLGTDAKVVFANLTRTATIWIFNLRGLRVASLEEVNGDGGAAWDLRRSNGEFVPAGIYIFRVTNGSETKMGKFAVVK